MAQRTTIDTTRKRLVIVESPTKAKTIRKFLPNNYQIEASMGHVRDLPAKAEQIPKAYKQEAWSRLGVNVAKDFEPLYIVPPDKKKIITKLKQALKTADELYIATDEDREGESIGWHLLELLKPKIPVKRMVFHEITQEAIQNALTQTRDIDQDLVEAQETRRVLDRLVGYAISPLLWKKIAPKLSAGRVQSVATRILVMREKERMAFMPASYWDLQAVLHKDNDFAASMTHLDGIRLAQGRDFDADTGKLKAKLTAGKDVLMLAQSQAEALARVLKDDTATTWQVAKVESKEQKRSPYAPFTTSTLQQEGSRKLRLSARDTMRTAQKLYENGYITYMRTDSTNLSKEAVDAARKAVSGRYGDAYLSEKPRQYKTKSRNAQEAHEAIRPAGTAMKTAKELGLSGTEASLYDLIWKRTVASQMAPARLRLLTVTVDAAFQSDAAELKDNQQATFRASGRTVIFPGFFRAYVEGSDDPEAALDDRDQPLPELTEGDTPKCQKVEAQGHETKPPARYTEASIVKTLEHEGIGRPSTYASIIDTIVRRGYVRKAGSALIPTFTAFAVNNLLEHQFEQLVDIGFTAQMENSLDDIAAGEVEPVPYLREFYLGDKGIETRVEDGNDSIDPKAVSQVFSPKWGERKVFVGRYGAYVEGEREGEVLKVSLPVEAAPADISADDLDRLLEQGGDNPIGVHPDDNQPMYLKTGPYGPYLQLGDGEKPKRISLPKGVAPESITEVQARAYLSLPRELGAHPDTGKPIEATIGPYGPYVKHNGLFASLKKEDDVLTVGYERAMELIRIKEEKSKPLKVLGKHPDSGEEVAIFKGRYGPYVQHKRTKASLPKGQDIELMGLEEAITLLNVKGKEGKGKKSAKSAKGSKKKTPAKKRSTKKNTSTPKATPADLEPFLDKLEAQDAQIVARLEGMQGNSKTDIADVADALGLSEEDVKAAHKRGMFKIRMAYGRARKANEKNGEKANQNTAKAA